MVDTEDMGLYAVRIILLIALSEIEIQKLLFEITWAKRLIGYSPIEIYLS